AVERRRALVAREDARADEQVPARDAVTGEVTANPAGEHGEGAAGDEQRRSGPDGQAGSGGVRAEDREQRQQRDQRPLDVERDRRAPRRVALPDQLLAVEQPHRVRSGASGAAARAETTAAAGTSAVHADDGR